MYWATSTSLKLSGSLAVCCASGEFAPNTVGTSTAAFSSTMLAVEKLPTVKPARVNGTQGAGVTPPPAYAIDDVVQTGFGAGRLVCVWVIGSGRDVTGDTGS